MLLNSFTFAISMEKLQKVMEQALKHTFRANFYFEISVSQSPRARVQKGLVGAQFYALKIIECSEASELFYRKILLDREEVARQLLSESLFEPKVVVETVIDTANQQTSSSRTYLYIFSPYVPATQICKYTSASPQLAYSPPQQLQERAARIEKIVQKAVVSLMRHSNEQLYSFQTFIFNEGERELYLNTTSFAGMDLLMYDAEISQTQFFEIYELLGTFTLEKGPEERFSVQLKFRALGMLILNMIIEKPIKVYFEKKDWDSIPGEVYYLQRFKRYTKQSKSKFKTLLKMEQVIQKINKVQKQNKVKYYDFLCKVFVEEQQLSWTEVIDLLVPKYPTNPSSSMANIPISCLQIAKEMAKYSNDEVFRQLGLKKSEQNLYFLCLLADEDTHVQQLLKYQNLDEFIYNSHAFNLHNRAVYKKILRVVRSLAEKKRYSKTEQYLGQMFGYDEEFEVPGVEEQEGLTFQDFLKRLSFNFGVHKTMTKGKKVMSWAPETKGIQKYNKLFK